MDHEHWQKVQGLFEAALERPPDEIPTWLEEACGGDLELKAEVEELLRSDAEAGSFIETVVHSGARRIVAEQQAAPVARRFGKYEIEEKIGQGGFGVVFRGRDPVLRRHVLFKEEK